VEGNFKSLGGTKMDEVITRNLVERDRDLGSKIETIQGGFDRLKDEVEDLKIFILESFDGPNGKPEEYGPAWLPRGSIIRLPRDLVYQVLKQFADRAASTITRKLFTSGIDAEQITEVLFAGGVSKSEEIKKRLMQAFPNAQQITRVAGTTKLLQLQSLTGAGCVEITGREMVPQLSKGLGIRQSDGSVCILLPAGFPVAINSYRSADFMVTNPQADEAIIEFGLVASERGLVSFNEPATGFESLNNQIFVPVGRPSAADHLKVADELRVSVAIDRDLAIVISVNARLSHASALVQQSGIPLILEFLE
jgi:hypothetical protein